MKLTPFLPFTKNSPFVNLQHVEYCCAPPKVIKMLYLDQKEKKYGKGKIYNRTSFGTGGNTLTPSSQYLMIGITNFIIGTLIEGM